MTPAKLRANRENAQRSRGPRTANGKARASLNARTHGLLSAALVLADEAPAEFAALAERVTSELGPDGEIERELVSRLTGLLWRLRRLARVETGLFTDWQLTHAATLARARASTFVVTPFVDALMGVSESRITDATRHGAAVAEAEEFEGNREAPTPRLARAFVERETTFANLARYESALESRFYRGLHELARLQDARAGRPVVPPLVVDVTITGDAGPELRNEATARRSTTRTCDALAYPATSARRCGLMESALRGWLILYHRACPVDGTGILVSPFNRLEDPRDLLAGDADRVPVRKHHDEAVQQARLIDIICAVPSHRHPSGAAVPRSRFALCF